MDVAGLIRAIEVAVDAGADKPIISYKFHRQNKEVDFDRIKGYPHFLLSRPGRMKLLKEERHYREYELRFIIYDRQKQKDTKHGETLDFIAVEWDSLIKIGEGVIAKLLDKTNQANKDIIDKIGDTSVDMDESKHNDNLIAVQFTFNLRVFHCE